MFDPRAPTLRRRLASGESVGLFWLSLGSAAICELAARHRPGAVVLDRQHGLWERMAMEAAIGLLPPDVPAIVRTAQNTAFAVGEALDAGAEGVLVPLVETAEEARAAASFVRYPPHGIRSGGGIRPLADFGAYRAGAGELVLAVMIETARGVDNAAAIAATAGVDAVFIGTGDLSLSLDTAPGSERHEGACGAVLAACQAAGKPCGIFTMSAEQGAARMAHGYGMAVMANDIDLIAGGFRAARAASGQG